MVGLLGKVERYSARGNLAGIVCHSSNRIQVERLGLSARLLLAQIGKLMHFGREDNLEELAS